MNNFSLLYTIVVIFNYLLLNVLADNKYYLISIRRSTKDNEYDKESKHVQNKIDELVNDRMNDIYDIISDNKDTYNRKNGEIDEKLEELTVSTQLRKRGEDELNKNKKFKFKFINRNRPKKNNSLNSVMDENEDYYIPFESKLVSHICPVSNYYVVRAYLSESIVDDIKKLPNIISCNEDIKLVENNYNNTDTDNINDNDYKNNENNDNNNVNKNSNRFYNEEEILKETLWKDLSVQENRPDLDLNYSHLSLISQGKYIKNSNTLYDNNYYYPSSAGKGIDIYAIDTGLSISLSEEDFDTYKGTPDERVIKCEALIYSNTIHKASNEKYCLYNDNNNVEHGTAVAISAVGKINGVAKKANFRMLATDLTSSDNIVALDYVKTHAIPHKTVVNISRGCEKGYNCRRKVVEDKIKELVQSGIIIIASAGNGDCNSCRTDTFAGIDGAIVVGAINNKKIKNYDNLEEMYERADYSNYGECVDLFAPGTIRVKNSSTNKIILKDNGTSFSSPMVAGVAATIMSDDLEVKYDYHRMRDKLINLSLKDIIKGIPKGTANRLVNNGKHSIYQPPRCDDSSNPLNRCQNSCCSNNGYCIDLKPSQSQLEPLCRIEYGCQSEFGYCLRSCGSKYNNLKCSGDDECCDNEKGICIKHSQDENDICLLENGCSLDFGQCTSKKCNNPYTLDLYKCSEDQCCDKWGRCINHSRSLDECFIEEGCIDKFSGKCLSTNDEDLNKYNEDIQKMILNYKCKKDLEPCEVLIQDYKDSNRQEICNTFEDLKCEQILKNPSKYLPNCKYRNNEYEDSRIKPYIDKYIKIHQFKCSIKDPEYPEEFCWNEDINRTFYEYSYPPLIPDSLIKMNCSFKECRENLLSILDFEINDYYGDNLKHLIESYYTMRNIVISDECVNSSEKQCGKKYNGKTCSEDECCTKYGQCIKISDDYYHEMCLIENGCQSEFGHCSTNKCGKDNNMRKCLDDECCSSDGNCVKITDDPKDTPAQCLIENGCQLDFGQCKTKRCDSEFTINKCNKGYECCSADGNCNDIFDDPDGMCFIENGCTDKYGGSCLTYDMSKLNKYGGRYQEVIKEYYNKLENKCDEEFQPYKFCNCELSNMEDIDKREELCKNYKRSDCIKFIESSSSLIPTCEKLNKNKYISEWDIYNNDLICAKKTSTYSSPNDFCYNEDPFITFYRILNDTLKKDSFLKSSCHFKECRESLLAKFKNDFEEFEDVFNDDEQEVFKNSIEYLSSEECIESKVNNKCGKNNGNNKCSEDECCSKYGVCVNINLSSIYNDICLIENGCQSEFGQCISKRCDNPYSLNPCSEDECCSKDGQCINILNDSNNLCFIENGCVGEFSGQCLSSDIKHINDYNEKYHNKILEYDCNKELNKGNCHIGLLEAYDLKDNGENERNEICKEYNSSVCQEFNFNNSKYIPSCEKIQKKIIYLDYSRKNFLCAKKNKDSTSNSNDYCLASNEINFFVNDKQRKPIDISEIVYKSCHYNECRLSLLQHLNNVLNVQTGTRSKNIPFYEDKINYLTSEECISLGNELTTTVDTTTTTTTTTTNTSIQPTTTATTTISKKYHYYY